MTILVKPYTRAVILQMYMLFFFLSFLKLFKKLFSPFLKLRSRDAALIGQVYRDWCTVHLYKSKPGPSIVCMTQVCMSLYKTVCMPYSL